MELVKTDSFSFGLSLNYKGNKKDWLFLNQSFSYQLTNGYIGSYTYLLDVDEAYPDLQYA